MSGLRLAQILATNLRFFSSHHSPRFIDISNPILHDVLCSLSFREVTFRFRFPEPGRPTTCPFRDAFHFSYNNNTGGFCREPTSYVKPCASDAKFRFHFKHCPHAAYTHNTRRWQHCPNMAPGETSLFRYELN